MSVTDFEIIKQKAIYEQIVEQIIKKINDGTLKSGDILPPEREFAKIMGVNRHTLREGLTALEYMGVVQKKVGVGTLVKHVGQDILVEKIINAPNYSALEFLEELTELRKTMEPGIAFLAAIRATPEDLDFIREAMEDLKKEIDDIVKMNAAHMRFHLGIANATRNGTIIKLVQSIVLMHTNYREKAVRIEGRKEKMIEEHGRIYLALKKRDPEEAQKAMHDHLVCVEELHRRFGEEK